MYTFLNRCSFDAVGNGVLSRRKRGIGAGLEQNKDQGLGLDYLGLFSAVNGNLVKIPNA